MKLRVGTRGSLLARAQTRQVCAAIAAADPAVTVDEVLIATEGDRDRTTPLWRFQTPGVFSHALDEAILAGDVDVAVHSFKDLGTERPDGIVTAAVAPRRDPRDVVLFRADILERLRAGAPVRLGTSAPRRETLLPSFLETALPRVEGRSATVQPTLLRGNVTSRLARVTRAQDADGALDAVPLALAGLARLWDDAEGRAALAALLGGLRLQVMPLTACPAAPGQGALAICCRADNRPLRALLDEACHDARTAAAVERERSVLVRHGGGCHQRFGVVHLDHAALPDGLTITAGLDVEGRDVTQWRGGSESLPTPLWDGRAWRGETVRTVALDRPAPGAPALFVAHHRGWTDAGEGARVWTSGVMSWRKLAERGVWVDGCAEGLGFAHIKPTLQEPVLGLPPLGDWLALTHAGALDGWRDMPAAATYGLEAAPSDAAIAALRGARCAYWASASQFAAMRAHAPDGLVHACGPGKTYDALRDAGLSPLVAAAPPRIPAQAEEA